jgi:hypothetical protein
VDFWVAARANDQNCTSTSSELYQLSYSSVLNKYEVKVTVKLSLCLTKHRAMKTYGGGERGIGPRILGLGTRWR